MFCVREGGYRQILAGANPQQSAVVADAEAQPAGGKWAAARGLGGPCANLLKEREFAGPAAAGVHVLRIGHGTWGPGGLRDAAAMRQVGGEFAARAFC